MVILGMNHALAWQLLSALGRHHRTFEDIRVQNLKDAMLLWISREHSSLSSYLHSSYEFSVATAEFRFP